MKQHLLTIADRELIDAAIAAVKKPVMQLNGVKAPAYVGAALRLDDERIITAVNLIADVGSLSVCAEQIVIAEAVHDHERKMTAIVAVYQEPGCEPKVISPCGRCREFIADYGMESFVILRNPGTEELFKVRAEELLPLRYGQYWDGDVLK